MSQEYIYPASISTNPSVGTNGAPIPTSSTEIGGKGPTGNLTPVSVDASGNINVNLVGTTPTPLPVTDAAAEASLASIDTKTPTQGQKTMAASSPVVIASDQSAVPISASSLPLPTGAATSANQTNGTQSTQIVQGGNTATVTASSALKVDGSAVTQPISGSVSVSNFPATQPVSGTVTADQGLGGVSAWKVDGSAVTQPISASSLPLPTGAATAASQTNVQSAVGSSATTAITVQGSATGVAIPTTVASLPLPSGAATSANQTNGNQQTQLVQGGNTAAVTGANALKVDGSAVTQPISAAALPLPSGAATSANQTTEIASLSTIATNTGNIPAKGAATIANSTPVNIASDQTVPTKVAGKVVSTAPVQTNYSGTPVTTAAYVQLVASTSAAITHLSIFDSSGQAMILATGAAASEVVQLYIAPGGGEYDLAIASGTRISIKALTATASSGYNLLNMLS